MAYKLKIIDNRSIINNAYAENINKNYFITMLLAKFH